jgi:hypothetical protein
VRAFLDGRHADGVNALIAHTMTASVSDLESLFVGEPDLGLPFVRRAFEVSTCTQIVDRARNDRQLYSNR